MLRSRVRVRTRGGGSGVAAPAAPVLSVVEPVTNPPAFNVDLPSGNEDEALNAATNDVFAWEITDVADTGFLSPVLTGTYTIEAGDLFSFSLSDDELVALDTGTYIARARLERGSAVSSWSDTTDSFALSAFTENFVVFDGSNDYLVRASGLTGAADTKTALFFLSWQFAGAAAADENLLYNGSRCQIFREFAFNTGKVRITINDTANGSAIRLMSSNVLGAERVNLLAAVDADGTSTMYLWRGSTGSWSLQASDATGGGANLDFTDTALGIGAINNGANKFNGSMARVAYWLGIAVPDLSDTAVRAKFADATTGELVNPAESRTAYGTPIVDFYGTASEWNAGTNKGSGGNYTMTGSVTDAA